MSNRYPIRSRKEDLSETVGKYKCDRCYRDHLIEELVEDEAMPGMLVCPTCFERIGFDDEAAENPKENVQHYFRS
jgi:transcription elongation factor Elf1